MSNVNFVIEDFAAKTVENPYTEAVAALIEAGEGKSITIVVPRGTKRPTDEQKEAGIVVPGDGGKDRLLFQQAANAADRTARVRAEVVQKDEDGNDTDQIALTITLSKKNLRAGAPKSTAEAEAVEADAEAPEAEAVEAPKPKRR